MEKNCDITGEMDDHLPIKRPREDHSFSKSQSSSESQSSSDSPVAAKFLQNDTNWVDLFVKEITSASDSDDARICAAKALNSFKDCLQKRWISEVKQNLLERAKVFPLEEEGAGSYFVTPDGTIHRMALGLFDDSDSEDEDEDEEAKAKEEEMLMRRKWGIDENGRMPENMQRMRKKFGLEPLVFGPIDKQPMDMDDGELVMNKK